MFIKLYYILLKNIKTKKSIKKINIKKKNKYNHLKLKK